MEPPKKLEGIIFSGIIPNVFPEARLKKFVELGTIVEKKGRTNLYGPLVDSLHKIQWVKLVGLKAISIERKIKTHMEPNIVATDPLGQTAHSLCVTDVLIHTKSALDSMAVFLTNLLDLDAKGGERDFKKDSFRRLVAKKDAMLKKQMRKLRNWFRNLQEIRDEWIHRSSLKCRLIYGPSKVGMLPIPRNVTLNYKDQSGLPITKEYYWSTKDFVNFHYSNLLTLFLGIVERSIQIEKRDVKGPIPIPTDIERILFLSVFRPTVNTKLKAVRVRFPESLVDW